MRANSNAHRATLLFFFLRSENLVSRLGADTQLWTGGTLVHPGTSSNQVPRWVRIYFKKVL